MAFLSSGVPDLVVQEEMGSFLEEMEMAMAQEEQDSSPFLEEMVFPQVWVGLE